MKYIIVKLSLVCFLMISFCLQAEEVDTTKIEKHEIDKATGLIKAQGWETVRNNCIACHSTKLITQNHGARNRWLAMIEWMQETQGLQQFDAETQETILSYLSVNYGAKEDARRSSLDPRLMPKNPYKKKLQPQL